jgi:hypothetical protein
LTTKTALVYKLSNPVLSTRFSFVITSASFAKEET